LLNSLMWVYWGESLRLSVFANIRNMVGCQANVGVTGPCFDAPVLHPYEFISVPNDFDEIHATWPLQHFPWIRDFVRIRGEAFYGLRRYAIRRSKINVVPDYQVWLMQQRSMPLTQEVPFDATRTPIYLPNDMSRLLGSYLDAQSYTALQQTSRGAPDLPIAVMHTQQNKDLWALNMLASPRLNYYGQAHYLQGLALWMQNNGYSEKHPLIIDHARYMQCHDFLLKYVTEPKGLNWAIKFNPELYYSMITHFSDTSKFGGNIASRVILPVQPGRPPSIVDQYGRDGIEFNYYLFTDDRVRQFMVLTEKMRDEMINYANDILTNSEYYGARIRAPGVLNWLKSEEYERMFKTYVKRE